MSPKVTLARPTDEAWSACLDRARNDVYHLAAYHEFEESLGRGTAFLAIIETGVKGLAWPYLLRPVDPVLDEGRGLTDITSVYGYPGPLAWDVTPGDAFLEVAWEQLLGIWREQRAVAAFTRFHPLLSNAALVPSPATGARVSQAGGGVVPHGDTLSIDCTLDDEEVLATYHRSLRQHLRVSRREGMLTEEDRDWRELGQFTEVYAETMERNRASNDHRFSLADFTSLRNSLAGHIHLLVTRLEDEIAAAGIFTEIDGIVEAHLVASRSRFRRLSPTKVLLDDARQWARARGNTVLHLGGGRGGSEDDTLFRFKREFTSRRHQFATGRWVLDPVGYSALSAARDALAHEQDPQDYFPQYRAPRQGATDPSAQSGIASPEGSPSRSGPAQGNGTLHISDQRSRPLHHVDISTPPNVLISSAGRRVGLVRAFQEAVKPFGGRVIATDQSPELSAACQIADISAQVPRIDDPSYLEATMSVAQENGAVLVIPTLDPELIPLAAVRDQWSMHGIHVVVPTLELVRQCRDKRLTASLFAGLGIQPIREVSHQYPRFVKPIAGSLSRDTHILEDPRGLDISTTDLTKYIHQELVDTDIYTEYTVDALYSRSGELVCAVPRRRIEVRGGEISKGRTEKGPVLEAVKEHLRMVPGAWGCLCMQFFHAEKDPERPILGIEVNARFGGGYPMSHASGARFAHWLVEEAMLGQSRSYTEEWKDRVTFLRFDEQVVSRA